VRNKSLSKARKQKNDEFYTQLTDIEKELRHYTEHFKGQVVYCNCDARTSQFWHYFSYNFEKLGLKGLFATCYDDGTYLVYDGNEEYLEGDGDFRSKECIELLKQADVVVTNPPFSLFREYVAQLVEHDKKFLIIGNMNAITYKEIFKLIKENRIWVGHNFNKTMKFGVPDDYFSDDDGFAAVPGVCWYTNLLTRKHTEELILYKEYYGHEDEYPHYDNYDAIEVSRVKDIPMDYEGVMGVPITFLDKHNPDQVEIVAQMVTTTIDEFNYGYPYVNGKRKYARILIQRNPQ